MFAKLVKPVFSDLLCRLRSCRPRSALGSLRRSTCSSSRAERHYLRRMNSEMKRPVSTLAITIEVYRLWQDCGGGGGGGGGGMEKVKLEFVKH